MHEETEIKMLSLRPQKILVSCLGCLFKMLGIPALHFKNLPVGQHQPDNQFILNNMSVFMFVDLCTITLSPVTRKKKIA